MFWCSGQISSTTVPTKTFRNQQNTTNQTKKKKGQTAISARAPTVARISMRSCFFTMCGIKYRAPRWRYRRNIVLFFQPKTIYGWIFGAHAVLAHDLRCDGRRDVRACVRSVPPPQAHRCVINLCAVSIHKRARAFIHERRRRRQRRSFSCIVIGRPAEIGHRRRRRRRCRRHRQPNLKAALPTGTPTDPTELPLNLLVPGQSTRW